MSQSTSPPSRALAQQKLRDLLRELSRVESGAIMEETTYRRLFARGLVELRKAGQRRLVLSEKGRSLAEKARAELGVPPGKRALSETLHESLGRVLGDE